MTVIKQNRIKPSFGRVFREPINSKPTIDIFYIYNENNRKEILDMKVPENTK